MDDYSQYQLQQYTYFFKEYLILILVVCILLISIGISYLNTLSNTLKEVNASNRVMSPSSVWLLIIPIFSILWNYFVVIGISDSVDNELKDRNIKDKSGTLTVGITYSILNTLMYFIWYFYAVPASTFILLTIIRFIFWGLFWNQVSNCKSQLKNNRGYTKTYNLSNTSNNNHYPNNTNYTNNKQVGQSTDYSGGYSGGHNNHNQSINQNHNIQNYPNQYPNPDSEYKNGDLYK